MILNILYTLLLGLLAGLSSFALSAFVEWFLHAKLLHGKEGVPPHESHAKHHGLHSGSQFVSAHEGESYGLGNLMFALVVGGISLLCGLAALQVGNQVVFWAGMLASAAYFQLLGFVHKRVHEPRAGGWFEKTALFNHLSRCHQVHHANDRLYFCIVAPFIADRVMRTASGNRRHERAAAESETAQPS